MASYKIILKPSVENDLRFLPREVVKRVFRRIEMLKDDPLPRQSLKLSGAERLYRVRVGEYRIIFGVDKKHLQVTIHHVRHRRDGGGPQNLDSVLSSESDPNGRIRDEQETQKAQCPIQS